MLKSGSSVTFKKPQFARALTKIDSQTSNAVTEQRNVPFNVNESAAEILKMSPMTHKGSIIVTGAD